MSKEYAKYTCLLGHETLLHIPAPSVPTTIKCPHYGCDEQANYFATGIWYDSKKQHGTNSSYSAGCRCPACTTAHATYVRELRQAARNRQNIANTVIGK